jgi:hypothetical protein
VVDCVKGSFNVELQETRYCAVAPCYVRSVDDQLDGEVCRALRTVAHLGFREESLGLRCGGDSLAYHCLEDLAYSIKE